MNQLANETLNYPERLTTWSVLIVGKKVIHNSDAMRLLAIPSGGISQRNLEKRSLQEL